MHWTSEDSKYASAHGWDLFNCSGTLEIQRIDCPESGFPLFRSDTDALDHVRWMASQGEPTASKALILHGTTSNKQRNQRIT